MAWTIQYFRIDRGDRSLRVQPIAPTRVQDMACVRSSGGNSDILVTCLPSCIRSSSAVVSYFKYLKPYFDIL